MPRKKSSFFTKKRKSKNHVLASLMYFLSVSWNGDDFWKKTVFRFFENISRKCRKINLNTQKTHINQCFGGLGASKMIPHMVFLHGDGPKPYFGWIN